MKIKKIVGFLTVIIMILSLVACSGNKEAESEREEEEIEVEIINYADAESFEAALNEGKNLEGAIVQFVATDFKPNSAYGYNIWAGEHLNFISPRNPDIEVGETLVVRATTIESSLGSWFISYEKVDDAIIDDSTISFSDVNTEDIDTADINNGPAGNAESGDREGVNSSSSSSGTTSFEVDNSGSSEQVLELVESGWYFNNSSIIFYGKIYNPNENLAAEFPSLIVTVKGSSGNVLATEDQGAFFVMPGDTITICSSTYISSSEPMDEVEVIFSVEWGDFVNESSVFGAAARTTDFVIENVSEINNSITGEITNNYTEDVDMLWMSVILRKDDEVIFIDHTFLDGIRAGATKAFQYDSFFDGFPEHDTIDLSVMVW